MSDDTDDSKKKGKAAPTGDIREKSQVEPVPKKADFFEWLEELFAGTEFPEKIEIRVMEGPKYARLGPIINQIVYKPNEVKPTKEKIVAMSNKFLFEMQRDCDIQRKKTVYGVLVSHFSRESDYYARYLTSCNPSGVYAKDGAARPDDEEDEEKISTQDRFSLKVLDFQERMFSLYASGLEGLVDRLDRIIERQDARIEKQDSRIEKQSEMMERALSMESERAERREWNALKQRAAEKGLDLVVGIVPPLVNQLANKSIVQTKETIETMTLKNFLKTVDDGGMLTTEQSNAAFGIYADQPPYDVIRPGVLSLQQAKLLFDVAHCKVSPDELDKIMPGGDLEITGEQLAGLMQCGFAMEQIAPLQMIFQSRASRKSAQVSG